jgi:hypothetical protein
MIDSLPTILETASLLWPRSENEVGSFRPCTSRFAARLQRSGGDYSMLSLLEPQDGDRGQASETGSISLGLPIPRIICKRDKVGSRGWPDGCGLSRSLAILSLGWARWSVGDCADPFPGNMFSAPVKTSMHGLANGICDTKVSVVISWMQPGTNGDDSFNFREIWECRTVGGGGGAMTIVAIQEFDGGNIRNSSSGRRDLDIWPYVCMG